MLEKGAIKWFDSRRGFGFIIPSKGGGDVRVLANLMDGRRREHLKDLLVPGMSVIFTRTAPGRSEAATIEVDRDGCCPTCRKVIG